MKRIFLLRAQEAQDPGIDEKKQGYDWAIRELRIWTLQIVKFFRSAGPMARLAVRDIIMALKPLKVKVVRSDSCEPPDAKLPCKYGVKAFNVFTPHYEDDVHVVIIESPAVIEAILFVALSKLGYDHMPNGKHFSLEDVPSVMEGMILPGEMAVIEIEDDIVTGVRPIREKERSPISA